jgi:hypothetical protein
LEEALAVFGEAGNITVLGTTFSNGNVTISGERTVGVTTNPDGLPTMVNLSYASSGSTAPYFAVAGSSVDFSLIRIMFNAVNKGPFVSIAGFFFFYFICLS